MTGRDRIKIKSCRDDNVLSTVGKRDPEMIL